VHTIHEITTITSTNFVNEFGEICNIEDDGRGKLRLMSVSGAEHNMVKEIGTINYNEGILTLNNFKPTNLLGNNIKIYAKPKSKDIFSKTNSILSIKEEDINISVEQIKE